MQNRQHNANIRLLACLVDEDDTEDSDYRFLVDGKYVKYVTTAPGAFLGAEEDRTFEPILLELLPSFPTGDWNKGHVARDPVIGKPIFVKTETVKFPQVSDCWHPAKFNELEFTEKARLKQRVRVSTHPAINDGKPVVVKVAVWPWEISYAGTETVAYERIKDRQIGPKFLGHITEGKDGRVIGLVTEWIDGARIAEPSDIRGCQNALGNLHQLGIKMGDINKHNFLVRDRNNVVLVDFETAELKPSALELEEEMNALKTSLEDASGRGKAAMVEVKIS
ncbi:kinase-like domain-containing protein [Fusarium heterosporum]|uniref:Kinase-like domain-containing protein n=1 Tax=Fusarium heterosporum TaxID=42747 RepID=A0A8H5TU22_FUSHE|nr:kinase-like domain-containing protein [Fusarium heterosporum]